MEIRRLRAVGDWEPNRQRVSRTVAAPIDQGDAQAEKQRSAGTKQHVGKADRAGVGGGKDVLKHR